MNETIEIMGLALTNKAIDKYFQFFSRLDNGSKKKLIIKLTEFIEEKESTTFRIKDLAGAREDLRDSDDIIKDIIDSKENKGDNPAPLH